MELALRSQADSPQTLGHLLFQLRLQGTVSQAQTHPTRQNHTSHCAFFLQIEGQFQSRGSPTAGTHLKSDESATPLEKHSGDTPGPENTRAGPGALSTPPPPEVPRLQPWPHSLTPAATCHLCPLLYQTPCPCLPHVLVTGPSKGNPG